MVLSRCTQLQSLDLCYATNTAVTPVMAALLALPAERCFTQLGVSGLEDLRDIQVAGFCSKFGKHVTLLGFGGCDAITNQVACLETFT